MRASLCWKATVGAVTASLYLGAVVLSGCLSVRQHPDVHDLFISNRRFNIDEKRGLVRVYARLQNTGESAFRQVEVHAFLISAGGDRRGENSVTLEHIKPNETRDFALSVTSHARTRNVVLEIREPENP